MQDLFTKTPLLFYVQNLWRDEAFSYVLATKPFFQIVSITVSDFNPPLYYIFLRYWMIIFGTTEIALRSLSFVFFLATAYFAYEILKKVFCIPTYRALIYFTFICCNPFLLTFAFEARMYMMVTFFVTLSYYALWQDKKKLYIAAITLAFYTHYFSVFIFVAQMLPFILAQLQLLKKERDNRWKEIITHAPYFALPVILFLPWVLFLILNHNFTEGSFWIIKPPYKDLFYAPFTLFTGYERVFGEYYHEKAGYTSFHRNLNITLLVILVTAGIAYIFKNPARNKRPPKQYMDVIVWALFPPFIIFIISYLYQPIYLPRYFIFSSVGFLILLIICIEYLITRTFKYKLFHAAILGVACFMLVRYTGQFNQWNLKYHSKHTVKKIYSEISQLKKPDDVVYLTSELDYHLAIYYLKTDKNIYIYNKTYEEIPQYVGKALISNTAFVHQLPLYPLKAFIVYYSWYQIQSTL